MAIWTAAWALIALALAAAVALGPLDGIAHVQDEVVYTWQAERLAHGKLFAPLPEPRAAHVYDFLLDEAGGRIGIFPLGWPMLLALGVALGAPAWINPLLHGLTVLLGAAVARRHGGPAAGWLAPPLLALAPQAVLLGASRMSHALSALLVLAAYDLALRPDGLVTARRGALLGGVLAAVALVRPFDAALATAVLLPVAIAARRPRRAALAACALGLAAGGGAIALQNLAMTGEATTFAQTRYFETMPPPTAGPSWRFAPGCNELGFGPEKGCFATWGSLGHTPRKALRDVGRNAVLAGSLGLGSAWIALLVPIALAGAASRRAALAALLLLLALAGGYALYWYGGACYGARFWHAASAPILVAVALGAATLLQRLRAPALVGLVLLIPMATNLTGALPELRGYWGIDDRFDRLAESWNRGEALVLVAYRSELRLTHPRATTGEDLLVAPHRWRAAWFGRSRGELVLAEYQPELVEATRAAEGGRPVWIYEMAADPREDRLRPLGAEDSALGQKLDLELPAALPLRPAPRIPGELWSGRFRVVDSAPDDGSARRAD